ncbi:MAG: hypothetical protein M1833_005840 [Piccolia ochrophora]|nr:MAG: hypothetical protein M1833_005840 [Piccolia ochrophora]
MAAAGEHETRSPQISGAPGARESNAGMQPSQKPSGVSMFGGLKERAMKSPAGGFDDTKVPQAPPGYTVRFTFHRAMSLPMADINTFSSDPFIVANLETGLPTRHKEDPPLQFRTPTIRRNTDPVWNCSWVVANIPASGFRLKARIYDEDAADHDDRLGNITVRVEGISESWSGLREESFKIKKRMGSKRAYLIRGCAVLLSHGLKMSGNVILSVEVLGRTEGDGGKTYTIGPQLWSTHYSPLIGRLAGTKEPGQRSPGMKPAAERYKYGTLDEADADDFQSNQIQLQGPVPDSLYHRYVEFKPFIKGMFSKAGLRGRILNHALHHQHSRVYNYDRNTIYGVFASPSRDMTQQFLDMVHHDQGGRIYTYVITLDGILRFTETGKEFGIDMLSKHTMHSDVNTYIAFSGEFFIRRLRHHDRSPRASGQATHPPDDLPGGPPSGDPPVDPAYYELIIDNDSGTYRPNAKYLPTLQHFLEANLPTLRVNALDNDNERLVRMKKEQRERKKKEGDKRTFVQASSASSISSSDESELDEREEREKAGATGPVRAKLNQLAEPKDFVRNWIQGDKEREKREEHDDTHASRAVAVREQVGS